MVDVEPLIIWRNNCSIFTDLIAFKPHWIYYYWVYIVKRDQFSSSAINTRTIIIYLILERESSVMWNIRKEHTQFNLNLPWWILHKLRFYTTNKSIFIIQWNRIYPWTMNNQSLERQIEWKQSRFRFLFESDKNLFYSNILHAWRI